MGLVEYFAALCWVSTRSSTWPRFCFFLGLDEYAADDEQAGPPEKLHEQARPSEEPEHTSIRTREKVEPMTMIR